MTIPPPQQPSQNQQTQQNQTGTHRNSQSRPLRPSRRASSETTPPPLQNQGNISYIGNDMIVQSLKNYDEVSFSESKKRIDKKTYFVVRSNKNN
jgi:hypothetical protein